MARTVAAIKTKWRIAKLPVFLGLNTTGSKDLTRFYSPDLQNVRHKILGYYKDGRPYPSVATRTGYMKYNDNATAGATQQIKGVGGLVFTSSGTQTFRIIACGNDGIYYSVPTAVADAWTALNAALTTGATVYPVFETYNNRLIISDGTNDMKQWDGTVAASTIVDIKPAGAAANAWITKATGPTARTGRVAGNSGFELGGKGYVTGGIIGSTEQNIVVVYDAIADTWKTNTGRMAIPRAGHTGVEVSGFGFTHGGVTTGGGVVASIEKFNPEDDVWTLKSSTAAAVERRGAASISSKAYTFGGFATDEIASVDYYEPNSDTWTAQTAMPAERAGMASSFFSSLAFATGGAGVDGVETALHTQYNASTDAWTAKTVYGPGAREGMCGKTIRGELFVGGGEDAAVQDEFASYLLEDNAWTTRTVLPAVRSRAWVMGLNNKFVLYGGINAAGTAQATVYSYNGNPTAPKVFWLKSHKSTLFGARTNEYPSRIFWSDTGTSDVWDEDNFVDVNKDDGGIISGMEVIGMGQYLAVFKTTGVYALDGNVFDPDPTIGNHSVRYVSDKGCASGYSIVKVNEGQVLYLGIDGKVYSFNGIQSVPVSNEVSVTISGFVQSRYPFAKAVYSPDRNEYWLTFASTGTKHNRIMVYSVPTGSWFLWIPNQEMDSLALVRSSESKPFVLAGAADVGFVYRWDTTSTGGDILADGVDSDGTGNGAAIDAYYQTSWVDLGVPFYKLLRRVYIYSKQTGDWNLTLDTYSDFSATADTTQTANLNSTNEKDRFNQSSLGNRFAWKFSNSTLKQYFEVESLEAYWQVKGGGMWT